MQTYSETCLDERIPLQLRRYWVFEEICKKAHCHPNKLVYLSKYSQQALSVTYLKDFNKYIAYGGVFEYAQNEYEIKEQGINVFPTNEPVKQALTVNRVQSTRPVKHPLQMLWEWNKYIYNRISAYVDWDEECFFRINEEIDELYPAHLYHARLVATARLPLWDNIDT